MSNRREHDVAGILTGALSVAASAIAARRTPTMAELLGGGLGGLLGSRLPDVLEPAFHPHHRGPFHSVTAVGVNVAAALPAAHRLHTRAVVAAQCESDPILRFLKHAMAAAPIGVSAGYVSHLALDATTSKSLPLLA